MSFCFKEPDYGNKIMEFYITLDELERENKRQDYMDNDGRRTSNSFMYQQPLYIQLYYHHQMENQNNHKHTTIYLERNW